MIRESIPVGRIAGIPVRLNVSLFVIVGILAVTLATGLLPALSPGAMGHEYVTAAVVAVPLLLLSLLVHELSHAIVARRNDIDVAGITLWLFGGVAELKRLPATARADFRVAIVGPLTSLGVAVGSFAVARGLQVVGRSGPPVAVFVFLAAANVLLAGLNLIPAAPLDGGRLLRAALWARGRDRVTAAVIAARAGQVVGFGLGGLGVLQIVTGHPFVGLWLGLVGLLIVDAATVEQEQARVVDALDGVLVRDAMTKQPVTADPEQTLDAFLSRTVLKHGFSAYPVTDQAGRLVGVATVDAVHAIPLDRRPSTHVRDIARPEGDVATASPDEPLLSLLPRVGGTGVGRVVVVDADRRVIGIVSLTDFARALLRRDPPPSPPGPAGRRNDGGPGGDWPWK
jgi:Zn-dependent protease